MGVAVSSNERAIRFRRDAGHERTDVQRNGSKRGSVRRSEARTQKRHQKSHMYGRGSFLDVAMATT